MDELVAELRERMGFKESINVGDVVLIAAEEPRMLAFAVVTDISPDSTRKDEWWHVGMQMLSVPLQPMTWTLRMPQMSGREIFTMNGKKMFMAPVGIPYDSPRPKPDLEKNPGEGKKKSGVLRIIK